MSNKEQNLNRVKRGRIVFIYIVFVVFSVFLVRKLFNVQHDPNIHPSELKLIHTSAKRGDILANGGELLATSIEIYDIYWDSRKVDDIKFDIPPIPNIEQLSKEARKEAIKKRQAQELTKQLDTLSVELAQLFKDRTQQEYRQMLRDAYRSKKSYKAIKISRPNDQKTWITYEEAEKVRQMHVFNNRTYGGLNIETHDVRFMPQGFLGNRTIGHPPIYGKEKKDTIDHGYGLERGYDEYLHGTDGHYLGKLANKKWIPANKDITPAQDGYNIHTTINLKMQSALHHALEKQMREKRATEGCAIVMETKTGFIRCMVNLTAYSDSSYREVHNYAVGRTFEPGSVYKTPALVAALETGKVDTNTVVNTGTRVYSAQEKITDSNPAGCGKVTLKRAFGVSSNVGLAEAVSMAYEKKPKDFILQLKKMGVGYPIDLHLAGTQNAQLYPGDTGNEKISWSNVMDLRRMAFGYCVRMTPMHTAMFYNAIANNGKMMAPQLIERITRQDNKGAITTIQEFSPIVINKQICSEQTIKKIQDCLEYVVSSGTGKRIANTDYKISGKTGTGEIREKGSVVANNISFAGYFPAYNPKYTCIVWMKTNTGYHGSDCAPVFKELADLVMTLDTNSGYGHRIQADVIQNTFARNIIYTEDAVQLCQDFHIPYTLSQKTPWSSISNQNGKGILNAKRVDTKVIPNVCGMTAKNAIYALSNLGLKVQLSGIGRITQQSIPPGSDIKKGTTIQLKAGK